MPGVNHTIDSSCLDLNNLKTVLSNVKKRRHYYEKEKKHISSLKDLFSILKREEPEKKRIISPKPHEEKIVRSFFLFWKKCTSFSFRPSYKLTSLSFPLFSKRFLFSFSFFSSWVLLLLVVFLSTQPYKQHLSYHFVSLEEKKIPEIKDNKPTVPVLVSIPSPEETLILLHGKLWNEAVYDIKKASVAISSFAEKENTPQKPTLENKTNTIKKTTLPSEILEANKVILENIQENWEAQAYTSKWATLKKKKQRIIDLDFEQSYYKMQRTWILYVSYADREDSEVAFTALKTDRGVE